MNTSFAQTKITPPHRREDLLLRPRLLRLLDNALDFPFTFVSAPAGYGKTSFLVDFAVEAEYPICWLSLDKLDVDATRFLSQLIGCVQVHFPDFGISSYNLIHNLPNPLNNQAEMVAALVNDLYQQITEHIAIILDDFHLLEENPGIAALISKLGQEVDENIHFVISSRKRINLPDSELLTARRMIQGITAADLAFTSQEIRSFFKDLQGQQLSTEKADRLAAETEGWITGLILAGKYHSELIPSQEKAALVSGSDLSQYFSKQIFENLNEPMQEFLLSSSVFEEYDLSLCAEVFGKPSSDEWEGWIRQLLSENLFIQQVGKDDTWIRYHRLFLEYLRETFKQEAPHKEQQLLSRLVEVYLHQEQWEKAYQTSQRLGDHQLTAQIIDQASSALFHQGRLLLLSNWLDKLDKECFQEIPRLEILRGICETSLGNPQTGLAILNDTLKNPIILHHTNNKARALLCRSTTYRLLGKYKRALIDANKVISIASKESTLDKIIAEAYREAGLSHSLLGRTDRSIEYLQKSISLYISLNDSINCAIVHSDIGLVFMQSGSISDADINFQKAYNLWSALDIKDQMIVVLNNLGNIELSRGNYIKAHKYLITGLDLAYQLSNKRMQAYIYATLGDLTSSISLYELSHDNYSKSKVIAQAIHEEVLSLYLDINLARVNRLLGKFISARTILNQSWKKVKQCNSPSSVGLYYREKGLLSIAKGKKYKSRRALRNSISIFDNISHIYDKSKSSIGLVLYEIRFGNKNKAIDLLVDTVTLLGQKSEVQLLLPILSYYFNDFKELLCQDMNNNLDVIRLGLNQFQEDLLKIQIEVAPINEVIQQTDHFLKIQGFGGNQVWQKNQKIKVSEWIHQRTVRELFFYLLTNPNGISREKISIKFWPDSSPRQLNSQMRNSFYRLRRAVGKDFILFDSENRNYYINKEIEYSYDVEQFQVLMKYASQETNISEKMKLLENAIKLYKHPFSPDLDGIWVEPIRRNLYLQYENAVFEVANYKLKNNNPDGCIALCNQIIDIDPCQEVAYQMCMLAFQSKGDTTGYHRIFQECKKNLNLILNTNPSENTLNLYNSKKKEL